jgi:pimeloyl-ACP methyl ester carboxylesterase
MAASIKDSQLAIIANCGHMSTMEKPDEVSRLLHHWLTRI